MCYYTGNSGKLFKFPEFRGRKVGQKYIWLILKFYIKKNNIFKFII